MAGNAIITGASSGIGAALARELSRRGWSLALVARRTSLLDELRASLPAKAVAIECDVTDRDAVEHAVRHAETALGGTFDLAIANAGVGIYRSSAKLRIDEAERTIQVNVLGMLYLFAAVVPPMVEKRSGRFVGIASLAGLRGLPGAAPYSASKAAIQAFLEGARVDLRPYGVGVTIVNPGFVKTPMTAENKFKMPFLMSAEKAATIIANGIERGKRVIEFPRAMSLLTRIGRLVPDPLWDLAVGRRTRR